MSESVVLNASPRCLSEALSELKRELQVRDRCYDRWVTDGRLTDVDARDRYERLASAVQFLQDLSAIADLKSLPGQPVPRTGDKAKA